MSDRLRSAVRIVAIALNLLALVLELNLEIQPRFHPGLHVEWTWAGRVEEFAPLLALIYLLWPTRNRSSQSG
jgi:hypothetical protein